MTHALNKYMGKVEQGDWNAPSSDQIKILALEAQVAKLPVFLLCYYSQKEK